MTDGQSILIVSTDAANLILLSQQIVQEGYQALTASCLEEFDAAVASRRNIALSIIDLSGFDQHIWSRCDSLRKSKVPFLLISPQRSAAVQRDSFKYGAGGLLVKPVGASALIEHIHTLLGD